MSVVAALASTIPACILEAVLGRLLPLFLPAASGDPAAARAAASHLLAAYQPRTEDELCLAATIVGFTLQSLDALGQSANPDLPLTRILRLRSGAVSLSREADKARRALIQMQKARAQPQPEAAEPQSGKPQAAKPHPAKAEVTAAAKVAPAASPATPIAAQSPAQPQTEADRQQDLRITESIKRAAARLSGLPGAEIPVPLSVTTQWPALQPL